MAKEPKPRFRKGKGLIAFMTEPEAISMMNGGLPQPGDNLETSRDKYGRATEALRSCNPKPADSRALEVERLDQDYLKQVAATPAFTGAFQGTAWSFKQVEIDNLTSFQMYVDLDYVTELNHALPNRPESLDIAKFCLPTEFPVQTSVNLDVAAQSITFVSHAPNMLITGMGVNPSGPQSPLGAGFNIGANPNYVTVVKYANRLLLKNGYHRLYALRQRGITTSPCVYAETTDFNQTGANRPGFFRKEILMSPRPPVVADFFDETLSAEIKIRPSLHVIRIKAEQFPVPLVDADRLGAEQ
ncbi:hypothetical protein E6H31_00230 [Candidatus Bathyarchaeota archaeon]|nr:MAG: hypothetical protein E6H31_00230 [Candidatus Bathyarchaeota archaeon]